MRLSLKKAVKVAACLLALLLFNLLVCFNLSAISFRKSDKLLGDFKHDNKHGALPQKNDGLLSAVFNKEQIARSRQERSAKRFPRMPLVINDKTDYALNISIENAVLPKRKLGKLQQIGLSHGDRPTTHVRQNESTELTDIFISVKTSGKFHSSRLQLLLQTWFLLAKEQTYFFSDQNDASITEATGDHLINTNCTGTHSRQSLCCKASVEFDAFLASKKRWMCHFDDDTYVNIPELVNLLKLYKHTGDWYLGKPSLRHPMEVNSIDRKGMKVTFWFATGSGFCISRGLALKMMPFAGGGRLMAIGERLRLPDDCVIGYIVEHLLRKQLTVIDGFRSHLEALWLIKRHQLKKQITVSYSQYKDSRQQVKMNVVDVAGFSTEEDPTRLLSVHCYLFPNFKQCRRMQQLER